MWYIKSYKNVMIMVVIKSRYCGQGLGYCTAANCATRQLGSVR